MAMPFRNEPLTDFTAEGNRTAMQAALRKVEAELGRTYPLIIAGEHILTPTTFDSINPANPDQVVGRFARADTTLAAQAIEAALSAFAAWQYVPAAERVRYLFKAAAVMRRRKMEFSAWIVYEEGKAWAEADADVAEAIDFLEFYGREMLRLAERQPLTPYPGEENELTYIPLGAGAIIPPWNFPCAITVGMTAAAIVAGNTVVLKPASAAPAIAAKFVEIMEEIHLPAGVLNFLPGPGGAIGDTLVAHPQTRFVAFTGSRAVGMHINQLAAVQQPGQRWLKRTTLEMGGKDAIIVDAGADLAAAAEGIVASAFGFQGQKCSACSRLIALDSIYDELVLRVVERARKLQIGPPVSPEHTIGPVIDQAALTKIWEYIAIGRTEGKLLLGGEPLVLPGYFVPPTIFGNVAPGARLAQEEIFGPVLACLRARDWDDAIAIANNTDYGLTGAVYSMNRAHLEDARRRFHVGNLYFNRTCTGAMVGVHPFGGFNMSGTDSKAGGSDYLLLFTQAKVVSERL